MKRITSSLLALLLALSMLIGMVPAAYAAPADTVESIDPTGTVDSSETEDVLDKSEKVAAQAADGETSEPQTLAEMVYAASDNETITLPAGTYVIPSGVETGKAVPTGLTIVGAGASETTVEIQGITPGESSGTYFFDGQKAVTFENLTIDFGPATNYDGFVRAGDMTFENVTIKGMGSHWGKGAVKFTNCSFVYPDEGYNEWTYNLWTYSGSSFEFKDCNFSAKLGGGNETNPARGKFVNVYSQATEGTVSVSLDTCKFKTEKEDGTTVTANKPILKIGNGAAWNISMTNIDITEAEAAKDETTGSKLYGSSSGEGILRTDSTSVTINGTTDWKNGAKAEPTAAAKIGDTAYETLDAAFRAANDNDEIIINAGTYEMSDLSKLSNKTVTVSAAAGATVVFDNAGAIGMGSASVTFKGITFDYMPNGNYTGLQHSSNMVYENCVFNGMVFLYGTSETFNTCKFNQTEEGAYNVWTYTGENVSFNNCEFTCYGRCVYIYNEGGLGEKVQTVSFVNSTFEAKKTVSGKAAIEISTELMGASATVAVDDKTAATGFATDTNSGSSLWNVKKTKEDTTAGGEKNATITVAGTQVFGPASNVASIDGNGYETLDAAITAAQTDDVITLIDNVTATATVTVPADKTITLDLNGKTYTSSANGISNAGTLTIKDSGDTGKLVATGSYSNAIENKGTLTIENGSYEAVYGAVRALGGSTTTIKAGTFSSSTGRYSMYYWANKVALTVTVEGGTFNNSVSTAMENGNVTLAVKGGSFATDLSDYCEEGFGTVLDSSTNLYVYGAVSHDGYVEDENGNVTISDEDGLYWFAKQVNNKGKTFSGKTVSLADDIALTKTWTPVGVSVKKSFQGTFDGQGHTISNMDVVGAKQTSYGYGFFKLLISATVKNVTFDNADVTGIYSNVVGIVSGYSYGSSTFENVHVTNSLVYAFGKVGGMVGMAEDGIATTTFKNCSVSDTTIHGGYNTAGFLGLVMGKCNITGSYLKNNNVIIDENSQGFGTITELDTTVACDGSVASCAGKGTVIKGKYLPNNGYYWSAYSDLYNHYGAGSHDCILADGKKLANSEVTHDAPVELNGVKYSDLQAAVDAAKDGDTVTLLQDCNGNGVKINTANFATTGLTVDFGGHTYSVGGVLVGSTGTGTNAFQLLEGGKVTFQNGTIAGVTKGTKPAEDTPDWHGAPAMVIQNYCDLTLKSMTITGGDETVYTMSNNHGDIVIEDTTITAGGAKGYGYGPFAFDVCGYDSYTGVSVTVKGSSTINGDIEVSRSSNNKNLVGLTLEGGTITGKLVIDSSITLGENTTITKSDSFEVAAPAGYKWDKGTLTKITYVAEVNGKQYDSLQAAITAAADGDTVTLLADTTEDVVISKNITLDLGGKTLTNTNAGKATISVTGGTVTVKNGNVVGGTSYYNIEVTKDSNANLTLEGVTATAGNTGSSMIDNWGTMTITSGTYTGGLNVVKSEEGSTLIINGGKFTLDYAPSSGYTATILVYGDTTITGGEFIQNATPKWGNPQVVMTGLVEGYTAITRITGGSYTNKKSGDNIFHGLGKATSDNFEVSGGTFNKSIPAGYCADGFIPTKNADGTYGVKEGKYVAQIGSKYYETLADAIRLAANGKTIELLTDVNEAVTVSKLKNITLDLNGFTLTNTEGEHTIVNNGTLTIKDSSTAQTGTVDNVTHGHGALVNNGTVILSGGTFERSAENGTLEPYGNGGNSWYTIANYGTMTINNGTTVKNAGGYSSNIRNGGQDSTAKLTINGGTFDGGVNTVKNDANGVLEIKGGELKNTAQYVIMNWNQATISGGTFETAETAGAVLFSSAYGTDGTACGELTITGGTFKAAGSKLIDDAYDANNHGTVKISGGSFNRAVDPKHCDTGFIPTQNADGTYGVKEGTYVAETGGVYYESLQAAIDAAPRKGTVKLLADTRENVTINTPYLTLDLNGHTLNGGTEKGKPALTVTARVTVKDGSEAQTGTIMREDTAENSGVSSHYVIDIQGSGWLTFESGNVKNGSGVVGVKGASLVRVGDDSVAKDPGLNIKGGTFTQDNFIVIKVDRGSLFLNGGTLNSANSYAIEDWHRATIKGGTVNGAVAAWTYSGGFNSDLTISGGTINGDVTSVNYGNAEGKTAKVSITGGTINGKLDTRSYDPATNELTSIDDAAKATIEVTGGTFNNDPTKYVVENSKVTNNADGTFGVEKAYLAKVGDTSYYTMDEAFKAQTASGEPIVLLRDYTTGSTFNSGSIKRTVDLGDHTWTYTGTDVNSAAFEINYPDATLTVKNGKVVSKTMLGLIPSAMGGTITYDNAGLVFDNVIATVKGNSGIETNGNNTNDSVTLRNSTLNVPDGFGIYFPSSGTLTIENSKINAKTMGVQVCAGSLKISGADTAITVTGDAVPKTENDGAIQDGAAISIVNRTGYKALEKIEVTGGTFTAKTGNAAIKAYNWANNTETEFTEPTKVEVSSGTFSAEVPADLCAPGYVPKDNGDGTYGVAKAPTVAKIGETEFTSLKDAIATAEAGATIDIVSDINTPTVSYEITKNLTINLNNKKITADGYDAVFQISGENANVVLNGPGEVVAVENTGSAGKYAMAVWACGAGCTVTINGEVKFSQTIEHEDCKQYDMIYSSKGTIIINGGHYESFTPAWTLNCKDAAYKDGTAKIIVNGGTFVGCDPRNNTAEGTGTSFVAAGVGVDKNTDGTFTAKPNMVAQIMDADGNSVAAYATLKEAVDAAKNGETVTLLADVDLDAQIATGKAITINGQGKYTIKATKKLVGTSNKAGMFYRTTSAQGTLTFLNVTLDGNGVSKIFLNEGGAGETVFDGVTSINGGGISYGSGIHISGGGSHATIKNSTLTGSKGTTELSEANYFAANDLWVGGNVYVTVENSTIGYVFVNSAPSATATNNVVHGQLTITGANTRITYLSGEEEAADKLDKFGNNGSLVKIDSGYVETIFDKGSYEISGGTFKTEVKPEWCADGYVPVDNGDGTYTVDEISTEASYIDANGKLQLGLLKDLLYLSDSKGKKLTIYKDIEIDYVVLLNDRELNLNGHTLTVNDTFVAVTGSVKDTEDGKGLIKIDAKNLHLAPNNGNVGQIPIFDSAKGGYRLFNFTMTGRTIGKGNGVEVDLRPEFTNPEAYELMKAGSTNNITFTVTISWMSENGPASQEFIFVQRLVDNVADKNGNGFFFIILNGLDSDMVGSIKDIKAQGSIKSGTGVSVNSVYYDIPQN